MLISNNLSELPWGVKRRLEFIELKIYWEGRLNRKDLMDHFRISVPQASSDLRKYQEIAPTNLKYDKSGKFYFPSPEFRPILTSPNPEHFLNQLTEMTSGRLEPSAAPIRFLTPCYKVPSPARSIDTAFFKSIINAISEKLAIRILYQSFSRPEPIWRWISPTTFGNDGFRWHVRAFCHEKNIFMDFVLGRILSLSGQKASEVSIEDDIEWNSEIEFVIVPHPELNESKKKMIELDYGMEKGELRIIVNAAFVFYLKKRLGFSPGHEQRPPEKQHIILKNEKQIDDFLCSCSKPLKNGCAKVKNLQQKMEAST